MRGLYSNSKIKVSLTAKVKPISRQGLSLKWGSSFSDLTWWDWRDCTRLPHSHSPALTHSHTQLLWTKVAVVKAATLPCIGITGLLGWKKRAAHSPRLQNCQDRNTTQGRHLEKPAAMGRACPSTNLNTNPIPEGFWGFFKKLENKIQDKWGKTSQSL